MRLALAVATALIAVQAWACSTATTTDQPDIVGSTSSAGRGLPYGSSADGPFTPLAGNAETEEYGRSPEHPIKLAGAGPEDGPQRSQLYLNALLGPDGEVIEYERRGSCCGFETPNSELGFGMLDVYELTYPGLAEPIVLYINMYDPGTPLIPKGLTARK